MGWAALTLEQRAELLKAAGKSFEAEAERIGTLLTNEMGKPLAEGIGETTYAATSIPEECQEIAEAIAPQTLEDEGTVTTMRFDPYGVVAAITPWNFPILMPHQAVIPALMAGNTVILKPSEETPLVAHEYVKALNAALPPNVLQIIHGDEEQGKALVESDVDMVVFTGSREAGKHILAEASNGLKRVILELGGKDPLVVLKGADIEAAAAFAARSSVPKLRTGLREYRAGSTLRTRLLKKFTDALVSKAGELKQGPGTEEGVKIGPMINAGQKAHVLDQVEAAVRDGAKILFGGGEGEGNFCPIIVLDGVNHEMEIMREETFGPVACVMRVSGETEAVKLANDTRFGLAASVFGEQSQAEEVASKLTAGMIGVNQGCGGAKGSPWVGAPGIGLWLALWANRTPAILPGTHAQPRQGK